MTAAIVVLSPIGSTGQQFFDNNGAVLSGGKLYFYDAGTTTPHETYTDSTGTVQNSNPIVLDSAGRISGGGGVWLVSAHAYKIVLTNSTGGTTFGTWNNITLFYGPTTAQNDAIAASTALATAIAATSCLITNSSTQSIPINTTTSLAFDTKSYDLGNNFNTATHRFTVPVTGTYIITSLCRIQRNASPVIGDAVSVFLRKNGSTIYDGTQNFLLNTSYPNFTLTYDSSMYLAAGDYIEMCAIGTGAAGTWLLNASTFAVARIS